MRRLGRIGLLGLLAVHGAACTASSGADASSGTDASGADVNPEDCTVPLESVAAACPATFDGTEAQLPPCTDPEESFFAWQCSPLVALQIQRFGELNTVCFYDSHLLVGVSFGSSYNTQRCTNAGRASPCMPPPNATRDCSRASGATD
jgi:hypothetical protein